MKILKWIGIVLVGMFALAGVAAVVDPDVRDGIEAGVDAAQNEESSAPEPTLTPEPTASPTPTPEPTATLEPASTGDLNAFLEYADHVAAYSGQFVDEMDALTAAANGGDMTAVFDTALAMYSSLGDEQIWLEFEADVRPCYEESYQLYSDAIDAYWTAMDLITDSVIYDDTSMMTQGIDALSEGNTLLDQSSDKLSEVRCEP